MKKILVLTPRFPYPVIGGDRLRIYKICEELSKRYSLTLLSLCDSSEEMSYQPSDGVFSKIHKVYHPKIQSYFNVIKALPTDLPLQIAYYRNNEFSKKLKEIVGDYDATLSHLIRVGDYVKDLDGVHILEMTDAISMNYERVRSNASSISFKSILYSLEFSRLNKYEKNIFKSFSLTSIISSIDRNYLSPSLNDNVIVCGNGVDFNQYRFLKRNIGKNDVINLVFIGNLYSLQNYDGIVWFINNIFLKLNISGGYRLYVLGKIRATDKKRLEKFKGVIVSGIVDDIQEAASIGHIGICPIRLGAGVQNKVLEYMAIGMPVISSQIGYEGIDANIGQEIFIADNIKEYIVALQKLKDENVYNAVALNARFFVEHKFEWSFQLSKLITEIEELFKK